MGFGALIAAYQETGEGELRALLPLAGRTLLEHQVRRAIAAGANHAVVLVERVPPALNAAIDRLRKDKIAVEISREASDAADRFHADEQVMLVADGLVAAPECFAAMAGHRAPALLTVADIAGNERFERIDADHRWAGLALARREMLADTAQMLSEWDPQSTLMRRLVQQGARRVSADAEQAAEPGGALLLAEGADQARAAQRALVEDEPHAAATWPDRFIYAPIAVRIAPVLLDRRIEAFWPRLLSIVLLVGATIGFWFGWLWPGLSVLLLSGVVAALAARIDRAQLRHPERHWEARFARGAGLALVFLALGGYLFRATGEPSHLGAAIAAIAALLVAMRERRLVRRISGDESGWSVWLAEVEPAIWLMLPFAAAGRWEFWAPVMAAYAVLSALLWQHALGTGIDDTKSAARGD